MHNLETIKLTNESYMEAIAKLAKVFPKVSRRGSGYTHHIGTDFSAYSDRVDMATACRIEVEDLFEYGRPKNYSPRTWVAKSSFVKIEFSRSEDFDVYYLEGGGTEKHKREVVVHYGEKGFGLANWTERKQKIIELSDKCNSIIGTQILDAVKKADEQVTKWKNAWNDNPASIL